jgi:hypothetical protein
MSGHATPDRVAECVLRGRPCHDHCACPTYIDASIVDRVAGLGEHERLIDMTPEKLWGYARCLDDVLDVLGVPEATRS